MLGDVCELVCMGKGCDSASCEMQSACEASAVWLALTNAGMAAAGSAGRAPVQVLPHHATGLRPGAGHPAAPARETATVSATASATASRLRRGVDRAGELEHTTIPSGQPQECSLLSRGCERNSGIAWKRVL